MSSRVVRLLLALPILIAAAWLIAPVHSEDTPAPKEIVVKTITLQDKEIPLSKALDKLKAATDVEVAQPKGDDPKLKLNLKKATFWQALDAIAKEADMRVALNGGDGKIQLVPDYRELPTSYSGPFRVVLKRLVTLRDLEADAQATLARMEVAWQPPVQGFLIESQPDTLVVHDDKGTALELPPVQPGRTTVDGPLARHIEVPLPTVRRSIPRLGLLKGSLTLIGSTQTLTFNFDKLEKGKTDTQEGVTVKLTDVDTSNEELWSLEFALKYPPINPKVKDFPVQSWLIRNQVYLVSKKTGMKFPANGGFEIDNPGATSATMRYRFTADDDNNFKLGKPGDWKLMYRTAGQIVEVAVPFEFKDVPLP